MFASTLAGKFVALTIAAPSMKMATKVHARGPETTGIWIKRGSLGWRKYREERLKKLITRRSSASQNRDRTQSIRKPKCSRLLKVKWLPTLLAAVTKSAFEEKRCQMYPAWRI